MNFRRLLLEELRAIVLALVFAGLVLAILFGTRGSWTASDCIGAIGAVGAILASHRRPSALSGPARTENGTGAE